MALTEMMKHYLAVKEKYPDCIIFYRLGDFYEMFFEDAVEASKVLDLTLTGKSCGLEQRAPMCGVPFHAVDQYIAKLVENGYKVAICEQLTEPKKGQLVKRDVVRVVTPGILMDEAMLDSQKNNYIVCLDVTGENNLKIGMACCDVSTGEFRLQEIDDEKNKALESLDAILTSILPSEIFCNENGLKEIGNLTFLKTRSVAYIGKFDDNLFDETKSMQLLKEQFKDDNSDLSGLSAGVVAGGALVSYMKETQKRGLEQINEIKVLAQNCYLQIDNATRRNLELTETIRDHKKRGSLLSVIDHTSTCMGGRLLRNWISSPLQNEIEINNRLDAIEDITQNMIVREEMKKLLQNISDIERIAGRIAYGNFNPKDALSLKTTASKLPDLHKMLSNFSSKKLAGFCNNFDELGDIFELLEKTISEEAPSLVREGNVIKAGYSKELDEYKNAKEMATSWLSELEAKERELTGIKNLRVSYNKVFGFFIEVNKSLSGLVPYRYQRKQTVANNERYITEELKMIEEKVENAKDNAQKLEIELFGKIRDYLLENIKRIQNVSKILAEIDCLMSGAIIAVKNNYCRPIINKNIKHIKIEAGRHPVVEDINRNETFVANDTFLNNDTDRAMIITGPNMAGKSTYMRQVALIVLLAHVGLFVPAKSAEISITDKIFTRIGASDDVAFGQSTFMVEMVEVANILKNATEKSLALLDEIGRGTSTFDGLSIAWAVMEHISKNMKMKTLFSTHYHELTELENVLPGVKNYRITVKEFNDEVIFLRKIARGGANKSFGIAVAKLAGLPGEVISRAKEISKSLELADINHKIETPVRDTNDVQKNKNIISILKDIDMNTVSPMSAFEILSDLIEKIK
ncbi:MAG: DNA mismatch repair protein MutS [Eubacteriales bacterium]|nr:DNA mismatch repair protein MutS [Eubacteriales bacterium]